MYFIRYAVILFLCVFSLEGVNISRQLQELHSRQSCDIDLQDYIKSFPYENYRKYSVENLGTFYLDNIQDSIKIHLRKGIYWEGGIANYIRTFTRPNTVAVDIGAHIGVHTLTMSKKVGPNGLVVAFEPQKKIFRELVHNIQLNGYEKNTRLLRHALGEKKKDVTMNIADSSNEGGTAIGSGGDSVEMVPLDLLQLTNVSFMKIDVEGYEEFIIDGAKKTILKNMPVIVIEILGNSDYKSAAIRQKRKEIIKKLEDLSYTVQLIFGHDYIAFPKKQKLQKK